ncbi:MAG: sugar ABC transporter ATP-binding protein [Spirochaetaceae bacterium]|nr:MAG: sugar ABC transporter ATP-binding protein [Spirochaetaceae bacterium]
MPDAFQSPVILRAEGITKAYPGTLALNNVSFSVHRGKVNALVGENGAGKSTLMKILAGVEQPGEGTIRMNDQEISLSSPVDAIRNGIGIIYQELDLCPNMSVVDNIFLARELTRSGTINSAEQRSRTVELLARLEHDIDPDDIVGDLRVGEQQIVAIAKALAQDVRILIMDEPTSSLSGSEVEVLFRVMDDLRRHDISIVYISHRLDEILAIGDHISVLRDGRNVADEQVANIDLTWIVETMIGKEQANLFVRSHQHTIGKPLLRVRDICLPRVGGGYLVDHVSFEVHEGEILGLFGLTGAGRSELLECLSGACPHATGTVDLSGVVLDSNQISDRIDAGIFLVPEDRQRDGLVAALSVKNNMVLSSLRSYLDRLGISLIPRKERSATEAMIKKLSVKVSDSRQLISSLSGGNQQKAIIAKGLLTNPKVLLLDEPTRGIDVGAKSEIFNITEQLAAQGYGVILVSSELKEVLGMADRILVMAKGKITNEFTRHEASEEALMTATGTQRI